MTSLPVLHTHTPLTWTTTQIHPQTTQIGQRAIPGPVGRAEHPLADAQAGGGVPQLCDDTGQFVPGHARRPVTAGAIGPRGGPFQHFGDPAEFKAVRWPTGGGALSARITR